MADTVELVKEKLSIIDVVTPYVKITKSGKHWRGLSPFNKEKTPSFFVSPERGTYYCFSSGQGGDIFTFIQKMEGVDFRGSLKILAEKAGVPLDEGRGHEERGKTDRLRDAMARAEDYYAKALVPEGAAYTYALSRGLTPESIANWKLGYAPEGWRSLLEHLTAEGFTTAELAAAGLIKEADEKRGTFYDRFRNRLMFPIRDGAGRTVAFTGRALPACRQDSTEEPAKYLNSPETELFHKSYVLFGMDKAKDAIRTRGFALLAEGQMDVLMLHQIGFTNAVALSGTALSKEHLALMKRYADNLMLALDADRAGLAASQKNAIAALESGMRVKAVRLPQGKDPADLAVESPKDLTSRIAASEPIVEFFLNVLTASESDSHHLILAAEETVLPLIAAIQSSMEREHFVGIAARALGSTPEAVRAALPRRDPRQQGGATQRAPYVSPSARPSAPPPSELQTLRLRAAAAAYADSLLAKRLESEYSRIIGAPFPDEPVPEESLFEAGNAFGEAPGEFAAEDLIRAFEKAVLMERLTAATQALRRAEASKDVDAIALAAGECKELATRLASFS